MSAARGGWAQVRAKRKAFEIVNARELLAVEFDVGQAKQQLRNLCSVM